MNMKENVSLHNSLIDVDDSVLIVIDVQERFMAKLPTEERELLANRIGWLISVATKLNVPLVVTAEDIPTLGSVAPQIAQELLPDTHIYNKMIFGLAADPEIMAAVKNTGRKTAILVGFDTDVCVAHSAIGLIQHGYQVVVVADATGSPGTAHKFGLERMRRAGVLVSSVRSLYYEWIRTVDRNSEFGKKYAKELGRPDGVAL
jgi:nicotinamidase-related amidase